MTDETPTLSHGDEYVALYTEGPFDGQSDTRISTDGSWDTEVTVLTAVDGKETLEVYNATSWRDVGGTVQVTYVWDKADSEPSTAAEARGLAYQ